MKKFLKKLLNRETVTYIIFGVLTTAVNYLVFYLGIRCFGEKHYLLINAAAFIAAAAFAYVTNKLFVFESKSWSPKVLRSEIPSFLGARIGSFFLEEAGMWLFVDVLNVGGYSLFGIGGVMLTKLTLAVVVVILNYILSKFFIFKKDKK